MNSRSHYHDNNSPLTVVFCGELFKLYGAAVPDWHTLLRLSCGSLTENVTKLKMFNKIKMKLATVDEI